MPRIQANGIELFYEEAGEGIPLVLQGHHHIPWMVFQVPYFSQFYRVITFDRRGTGRSASPSGEWTNADFASDLAGLLDGLQIDRAIVGGASLGGVIACQFGLDVPDRALALIIGHTVPFFREDSQHWIDDQIQVIEQGGRPIVDQPRSFEWEEKGPPTQRPGFELSEFGQYLATLGGGIGKSREDAVNALRAIRAFDTRPRADEMARFGFPVLVLVGGNESQKTVTLSYEWHKMIPGSEFYILPNTHHGAARENPIGWNSAVHSFLQRHGLGGTHERDASTLQQHG
jgi:pimeloyl-ACP methyl ester carboxylesterase